MRIVDPEVFVIGPIDGPAMLRRIERAGRTCYRSEERITGDSTPKFVRMVLERGHESVLEHEKLTVRFVIDRGVSHELVRHRIASYSQESTRYCNYAARFGGEIAFVRPPFFQGEDLKLWEEAMNCAANTYSVLVKRGHKPEEARSVLPNSLRTEIVMTANVREWRHVLRLRTAKPAHPQMRQVMVPLLHWLQELVPREYDDWPQERVPVLFEDIVPAEVPSPARVTLVEEA